MGDRIMGGLRIPMTGKPLVAFTPPSVVQHQTADWSAIRADNVEGVRHEAFDVVLKATSHHLLIAHERAERYDGETFVDGLQSHVFACGIGRWLSFPREPGSMVGGSRGPCRAALSS